MYGKVFRQMYKGSMSMAGWEAVVTLQQLIVLADRHGVIDMTPQAIAGETTIPLDIIQKGLEVLSRPDPESRTPDEDGRRIVPLSPTRSWGWQLVNYDKYRAMRDEEDRREYQRQYWHKRKDSTKLNSTQPNSTHAEADADAEGLPLRSSSSTSLRRSPSDRGNGTLSKSEENQKALRRKIADVGRFPQ